ncbi:uncharacterized protein LOC129749732 [Uranotaenia lowii]|uniref:uncharacterized protein LOC129749732 n=1 Tax=Uranotaenia lowii TaxID=190385 RepID=UPI00247B27F6|nr:uncharacterized protein LOC129749732 [Uranotaenia lowii]
MINKIIYGVLAVAFVASCLAVTRDAAFDAYCKAFFPGGSGFLAHPTECTQYISCYIEEAYVISCPAGQNYDLTVPTCSATARCNTFNCTGDTTVDFLPIPGVCTHYVACFFDIPMAEECAPGTEFSETQGGCVPEADSDCLANPCTGVTDPATGLEMHEHPRNCNQYIICDGLDMYLFDCGTDLCFDLASSSCLATTTALSTDTTDATTDPTTDPPTTI